MKNKLNLFNYLCCSAILLIIFTPLRIFSQDTPKNDIKNKLTAMPEDAKKLGLQWFTLSFASDDGKLLNVITYANNKLGHWPTKEELEAILRDNNIPKLNYSQYILKPQKEGSLVISLIRNDGSLCDIQIVAISKDRYQAKYPEPIGIVDFSVGELTKVN